MRKKKTETPGAKLIRFRNLHQKAIAKPGKLLDQADALLQKRHDKVDAEIGKILESTLKTGFLDYQLTHDDELVIECSAYNRDPLDQARKLLRLIGISRICFIVTNEVREVV